MSRLLWLKHVDTDADVVEGTEDDAEDEPGATAEESVDPAASSPGAVADVSVWPNVVFASRSEDA
jgi:hypothetical protein